MGAKSNYTQNYNMSAPKYASPIIERSMLQANQPCTVYENESKLCQKNIEQCSVGKIDSSVEFQEALLSKDILCCVPHYSSGYLFKYMKTKTTYYEKKLYTWTKTDGHQIISDWDSVVGIANTKNIQTAVCCFYHGEDGVFPTFLEHFKGETLVLISDTALFEDYYEKEYVHDWRLIKDINIGVYLHMLVFSRNKLELATRLLL